MKYYVYRIIDPRTAAPFYIGMSSTPEVRLGGHYQAIESSARTTLREIYARGYRPVLEVVAEFENKDEALRHEAQLIRDTPGLTNLMRPYFYTASNAVVPVRTSREVMLRTLQQKILSQENWDDYVPAEEFDCEHLPQSSFRGRRIA